MTKWTCNLRKVFKLNLCYFYHHILFFKSLCSQPLCGHLVSREELFSSIFRDFRKWTYCCRSGIFLCVQFSKIGKFRLWRVRRTPGKILIFKKSLGLFIVLIWNWGPFGTIWRVSNFFFKNLSTLLVSVVNVCTDTMSSYEVGWSVDIFLSNRTSQVT